jgi:hypothetical protein
MSNTNKNTKTNGKASNSKEAIYRELVTVRNTELIVYWARYNIQSAINFGLLVAVLANKPESFIGRHMECTAFAGILLALIWLLFIVFGKKLLIGRWERHIRTYENNISEVKYRLFSKVKEEEESKCIVQRYWDNLTILSCSLPLFCIGAWFVIAFNGN